MKRVILILFLAAFFAACGGLKVYNNALKQIELGMTRQEVVALMGDKYNTTGPRRIADKELETLEYKDMYKNHFFFEFSDNQLYKWYKETEEKK